VSKGLPESVRKYLDAMDSQLEELDEEKLAELVRQATLILNTYQGLHLVALARMIMEPVVAMDGCLARAKRGSDLEQEVRHVMWSGAMMAALLTRQARGRPKLLCSTANVAAGAIPGRWWSRSRSVRAAIPSSTCETTTGCSRG